MPLVLQARKHLEEFQKHRARCLASCAGVRDRKARATIAKFLALNLAPFRLQVDDVACALVGALGDGVFTGRVKGIASPVDLFFGAVMRLDIGAGDPGELREHILRLHRAGLRFMQAVRSLSC